MLQRSGLAPVRHTPWRRHAPSRNRQANRGAARGARGATPLSWPGQRTPVWQARTVQNRLSRGGSRTLGRMHRNLGVDWSKLRVCPHHDLVGSECDHCSCTHGCHGARCLIRGACPCWAPSSSATTPRSSPRSYVTTCPRSSLFVGLCSSMSLISAQMSCIYCDSGQRFVDCCLRELDDQPCPCGSGTTFASCCRVPTGNGGSSAAETAVVTTGRP